MGQLTDLPPRTTSSILGVDPSRLPLRQDLQLHRALRHCQPQRPQRYTIFQNSLDEHGLFRETLAQISAVLRISLRFPVNSFRLPPSLLRETDPCPETQTQFLDSIHHLRYILAASLFSPIYSQNNPDWLSALDCLQQQRTSLIQYSTGDFDLFHTN